MKKNEGITLIALIITIIILIILTAVTINNVIGTDLIGFATKAVENYTDAAKDEVDKVDKLAETLDNQGVSDDSKVRAGELVDKTEKDNYTDAKGNKATIPEEFKVSTKSSEQYIDDGLVIQDAEGNEFVWIPVNSESELARTSFDSNGNITNEINDSFTEPCNYNEIKGYQYEEDGKKISETDDFNEMKKKVIEYKGFYIGRYEAGIDSKDLRTGSTEAKEIVIKAGVSPYNYVKWGDSMTNIGDTGAVYLAKNKYNDNPGSVVSTLIYGCQWDAMCKFIGPINSSLTIPKKDKPELTGSVPTDCVKNIYDLAGNCIEWTMEAKYDQFRSHRGGRYTEPLPVYYRNWWYVNIGEEAEDFGFRITLYIK